MMTHNKLKRPVSLTSLWSLKWTPEKLKGSFRGSTNSLLEAVQLRGRNRPTDTSDRRAVKSLGEFKSWDDPIFHGSVLNVSPLKDDEGNVTLSATPRASPSHSLSSTQLNGTSDKTKPHDAWGKLARLLNQRDKATADDKPGQFRRRTYSLESNDSGPLRRASSIDCLVDPCQPDLTTSSGLTESKSIQLGPGGAARLEPPTHGDIPLSPSVPTKLGKYRAGWRRNSMELLTVDGIAMTKAERKKLEKLNKINIHLHALFVAVEHHQLEKARTILENSDVDINGVNGDGLNALDICTMTHNVAMIKLLQSFGAKENTNFVSRESRAAHLNSLVNEAEKRVEDLTNYILNVASTGTISAAQLKEKEKQLSLWDRRHRLLKRIKLGFDQSKQPEVPSVVSLNVISTTSVRITFAEPRNQSLGIATKYKVQWSLYDDFTPLEGEEEIFDLRRYEYDITRLQQGTRYYVRMASGNFKGYGSYQLATPVSAIPSIWRDVDRRSPRSAGRLSMLDDLFNQIRNSRPEYASEIKGLTDQLDTPIQQRRNQMRKSIKSLFTPAPKFHKHLKRGVFLACLLFNDDRILVTTEETLPVVEVDETYPSSFHTDFHWMMKVACTWDDVKSLRQDMEKSLSSSIVYSRSKLLQAAAQMQNALSIQDLGQFFYRPLKDSNGTIVICTVNQIRDVKMVNALSMKWIPASRLNRRNLLPTEQQNAGDMLLASISEQISYHQVSRTPLASGLYLGYLKLKSSMDLIRVLVPAQTPNALPHCLIRENSHISCEEWEWLKSLGRDETKAPPTPTQIHFSQQLLTASRCLFNHLGVPWEEASNHRFYDVEVIELCPEVSFILVLPAIENVCSVPGQNDELTSRLDFITLPVQIFEMVHMTTYQRDFISRYSRLSSILEMDTIMAQHAHREAFSSTELSTARQRLSQLQEFQLQVDNTWKGMRWIMDVLTWARDKQAMGGLLVGVFYNWLDKDLPTCNITIGGSTVQIMEEKCREEMKKKVRPKTRGLDLVDIPVNTVTRVVSADNSPVSEQKSGMLTVGGFGKGRFPHQPMSKSYSDTFTNLGLYETGTNDSAPEDSGSSVCDALSLTASLKSLSSNDIPAEDYGDRTPESPADSGEGGSSSDVAEPRTRRGGVGEQPGILRVYAAYNTGLASGTSVKLHVTPRTTVREVVDLVVRQLSIAASSRGLGDSAPIYTSEQFPSFCLVAVLGARERCLRDDFRPLHLQNPWTKGRLYVRMKIDVLAALQQHSAQNSAYL